MGAVALSEETIYSDSLDRIYVRERKGSVNAVNVFGPNFWKDEVTECGGEGWEEQVVEVDVLKGV